MVVAALGGVAVRARLWVGVLVLMGIPALAALVYLGVAAIDVLVRLELP